MSPPISPLILVVEDDANDALLLERAFQKSEMPIAVKVLRTVDDAIAYLQGRPPFADRQTCPMPVLILQDIKLPLKSGFDFVSWLRAQPALKRLPVIMLTSSKAPSDINRAYELGANSYLVKPVAFESFRQMIKTLQLYWLVHNQQPTVVLIPPGDVSA